MSPKAWEQLLVGCLARDRASRHRVPPEVGVTGRTAPGALALDPVPFVEPGNELPVEDELGAGGAGVHCKGPVQPDHERGGPRLVACLCSRCAWFRADLTGKGKGTTRGYPGVMPERQGVGRGEGGEPL